MDHEHCKDLLGHISGYLDGETSEAICDEIERHLAECTNCQVVVDTMRKTVSLYRHLPKPSLSQQAKERLYASLDLSEYLDYDIR